MGEIKNIGIICALSIVLGLQILVIVSHIYSFIPIHWNVPIPPGLELERESFLYVIFLSSTLGLSIVLMHFLFKPLNSDAFKRRCLKFLYVEILWLLLMLFVFFKWLTYRYPFYNILPLENGQWVLPFFYVTVGLSLFSKIFWPEVDRMSDKALNFLCLSKAPTRSIWVYILVVIVMMIGLYPNRQVTVAIIASWSNFSQWQGFWFTKFLITRGFSMEDIVMVLCVLNCALLAVIFIAAHRYLKSLWLAGLVLLIVIQMTLFHYGMSPVCWSYPQNTLINLGVNLNFFQDPLHPPMFLSLRVRQFLSFFMGYGIIILYVFNLLNAWGKDKVAVILSLLGILTYTRYIANPDVFAFGAVCWPAVFIMVLWFKMIINKFYLDKARQIYAVAAFLALFLLLTNRVFVTYPHFWVTHV